MNRYLSAEADPTTLIDPDGHAVMTTLLGGCNLGAEDCATIGWTSYSTTYGQTYLAKQKAEHRRWIAWLERREDLRELAMARARAAWRPAAAWRPPSIDEYYALRGDTHDLAMKSGAQALAWLRAHGSTSSPADVLAAWYLVNEWEANNGWSFVEGGRYVETSRENMHSLSEFLNEDQILAYAHNPDQDTRVTIAIIGVSGFAGQTDRAGGGRIGEAPGEGGFGGSNPIAVIGRSWDTEVAKDWPGHETFAIQDWTVAKNDEWVQSVVDRRMTVYVGSSETEANLWDSVAGRQTVFARELSQFKDAGYVRQGDYYVPGGN
jgi:hypothetical protein